MRLWTFQPASILPIIENTGCYHPDPTLSDCLYPDGADGEPDLLFHEAYDYMADRMTTIGITPSWGSTIPIWAWHTTRGQHRKPDLRTSMFSAMSATCGEPIVLLHLDVPHREVCLSDFDGWHYVINKWYYPGEVELEGLCYCVENPGDSTTPPYYYCDHVESFLDEKYEAPIGEMMESWGKIFNPEFHKEYVQACFWDLKEEYILKIDAV